MAVTFKPGRDGERSGIWVSYTTTSGGRVRRTIKKHLPAGLDHHERVCADLVRLASQGRLSILGSGSLAVDGVIFGKWGTVEGESQDAFRVFEQMDFEKALADMGPMVRESPAPRPLEGVELAQGEDGHVWLRSRDRIALRTRYPFDGSIEELGTAERHVERVAEVLRKGRVEVSISLTVYYGVRVQEIPGIASLLGWPSGWGLDQALVIAKALTGLIKAASNECKVVRETRSPSAALTGSWVTAIFDPKGKTGPTSRFDREPLV